MKQLLINTVVSGRETNEFIQRGATINLTDEEVDLFVKFRESIIKNHGTWPFDIFGFGAEDPTDISLESPLASKIRCYDLSMKPKKVNRFDISQDLTIYDTESEQTINGWRGI